MAKHAALVDEAGRLFVEEGLCISEIAELMPEASRRTLENWSVKYQWASRRARYRKMNRDLDGYVQKIKIRLATALMDDEPDPQLIYALGKGLAVLKPSAAVELRKIEKAEAEASALSPEEKREKVKQTIEAIYGVSLK